MKNQTDNEIHIAKIRVTIADGQQLTTLQLKKIREIASSTDAESAESAMSIMKLDPWATKIHPADTTWLERLYDVTPSPIIKMCALRLLCLFLSEVHGQRERILTCLKNAVEIDKKDWNFLITACSCAGFSLSESYDRELASALVNVMRAELMSGTRDTARDAVLMASGMKSAEIVQFERQRGQTETWKRAELAASELLTQ